MMPFIAVLLLMVLICEYAAGRNRESGVRVLVALAADVAIWALLYIYSGPESTTGRLSGAGYGRVACAGAGAVFDFWC